MAEAKKLGELLIEAGLIDDFQLASALSHQRNWGGKLGTILVEMEFASEEDVAKVIAEKLKMPYAELFEPEIPEAVLTLIKPAIAKKYVVMPVRKEPNNVLLVAMSNPLDIEVMDSLRFATNLKIKAALAFESEIKLAIRKYYDKETIIRKPRPPKEIGKHSATGGKMEIIRGSDLTMPKTEAPDAAGAILAKEDSIQQALADNKLRIDALIALLLEKELITRAELTSMIYQKKLGL